MSIENKFVLLRKMLFKAIEICLKEDSHCKACEGTFNFETHYPDYFETQRGAKPVYQCTYWCYLICEEGRNKTWKANSYEELYELIEKDILHWLFYHQDCWELDYIYLQNDDEFKQLFDEFNVLRKEYENI